MSMSTGAYRRAASGRRKSSRFIPQHLFGSVAVAGLVLGCAWTVYSNVLSGGIYPSMGPGEPVADKLSGFAIGHGLFSLLDAFPFQHPDAPELSVSIPISERIFGQGAGATFGDFVVTIDNRG